MKNINRLSIYSGLSYKICSCILVCTMIVLSNFLISCETHFDAPPYVVPSATWQSNTTILELKTTFNNNLTVIGKKANGEDYIIKGKVIGNDISGNIYKNIMLQDATAAITIAINSTGLYNNYHLGQEIVINCTGLTIGKYSGLQQLGAESSSGSVTFMELPIFKSASQLNGMPFQTVDTLSMTIAGLSTSSSSLLTDQSQLVVFKGVHFEDGGQVNFTANDQRTTRYLLDANGNKLAVLNSQYSDFATKILPKGVGNVVGILYYYNSAYQLLLIQENNCYDFDNSDVDDNGGGTDDGGGNTDMSANTTILELKTQFQEAYTTIGTKSNGDAYIIKGVVVGNDVENNIYKNLILQDASAAITIGINQTDLYKSYPIGQEVTINCTGMVLGKFNGLQQLGALSSSNAMTFMDYNTFTSNSEKGSTTGTIDTIKIDIVTANSIGSGGDNMLKYQSQLIQLSSVKFKEGGIENFGVSSANTNRILENSDGSETIIVRTSRYSMFVDILLPSGTGNVVGILSYYTPDSQLLMRMATDAFGFTKLKSSRNEYVSQ